MWEGHTIWKKNVPLFDITLKCSAFLRRSQNLRKIFQFLDTRTSYVKTKWVIFFKFLWPSHKIWTVMWCFLKKNNPLHVGNHLWRTCIVHKTVSMVIHILQSEYLLQLYVKMMNWVRVWLEIAYNSVFWFLIKYY